MKRTSSESGFSVLEVFVSMVLLLVVAAFSAPALSEYSEQFQLRSAMDRLSSEIGRARMQAVAQSAFVRVRFDESGHFVRERSLDGTDYESVGTPFALPPGITATISGNANITFDSTGISASPSVVTFEAYGQSKSLYTNILGRVTPS